MKTETVKVFIADDGSKHFTETECLNHNKKIKQNEKKRKLKEKEIQKQKDEWAKRNAASDYIRLNAESLDDIKRMMIEFAKEHYGVELKITQWATSHSFSKSVSNTHNCPYVKGVTNWGNSHPDRPTGYPGWSFQIKGTFSKERFSIFGFVRGGHSSYDKINYIPLHGLHTGGGSGGSNFACQFLLFLQDFPKLEAKYKRHQELEEKLTQVLNDNNQLAEKRHNQFEKSKEGKDYNNQLAILYVEKEKIQQQINQTESKQHQQRKEFINDGEFTEFEEQKELDELANLFHKVYRYERNYS